MSDKTGIAWTDATWNPIRGCSRVSAGCVNCYAEKVAVRFDGPGLAYEGLTTNGRWNGTVVEVPKHLTDPIRWKRPRRIFVNSMSDLFHASLTDESIDKVFAAMAVAQQHEFQVLTKRPERMRDYLTSRSKNAKHWKSAALAFGYSLDFGEFSLVTFPLPNVLVGTSVEDQASADKRVPILRSVPWGRRFVSYEPAIGPATFDLDGISWVIVGGESQTGHRPFDVAWARATIAACRGNAACFVKQLGSSPNVPVNDRAGADPSEWPEDLRVREFPTNGPTQ